MAGSSTVPSLLLWPHSTPTIPTTDLSHAQYPKCYTNLILRYIITKITGGKARSPSQVVIISSSGGFWFKFRP